MDRRSFIRAGLAGLLGAATPFGLLEGPTVAGQRIGLDARLGRLQVCFRRRLAVERRWGLLAGSLSIREFVELHPEYLTLTLQEIA